MLLWGDNVNEFDFLGCRLWTVDRGQWTTTYGPQMRISEGTGT